MPVRARAQRLRRSLMILGLIALAFIVLGTTLTYSRYRRVWLPKTQSGEDDKH